VWRTRRGDRLSCASIPADRAVACITAAHQAAERFGECTCGAAVSREPPEQPSPSARHAGAHQLRGPAAPPPSVRCSGSVWGLAGRRLTIGCSGCGAGHVFGRRKVLCDGPAPLTLGALGAAHLRRAAAPQPELNGFYRLPSFPAIARLFRFPHSSAYKLVPKVDAPLVIPR
jgi:hypothetical protein